MAIDKETILSVVRTIYPDVQTYEHRGQLSIIVSPDKLTEVARELKENPATEFDMLKDITAIDWARPGSRYETVSFLYSTKNTARLRIKTPLEGENPECPTLTGVWESANWYERETFDMYGIKFPGHPGLRRFYMPDDFKDPETGEPIHPLRKDFPLMGIPGSVPLPQYPEKYGELQ